MSTPEQTFFDALEAGALSAKPAKPGEPTVVLELANPAEAKGTFDASQGPGKVTASNLFRHYDAHPIVLDLLLLRAFGPDWMSWASEGLLIRVPEAFAGQTLSSLNLAKIQACQTLHLVDTFWAQWEIFGWCTMAFNGVFPDFEVLQVPSLAQCLVSIDMANRIRADVSWAEEIKGYLSAVYRHDGIFRAEPPADFVHIEVADFPIDQAAIEQRWPPVRATGVAPSGDNVTDEQLRRLLIAHTFLEESRTRLREQLRMIADA